MVGRKCSILTCRDSNTAHHRFPNPNNDFDRYKLWLLVCGNVELLILDPIYVYKSKTVCIKHFSSKQVLSNTKLIRNAVPDLLLPSPINIRDSNFSQIRKPKQDNINIVLFDEATAFNEDLLGFHNFADPSIVAVTNSFYESNTDDNLNTKDVAETIVNNDTNKMIVETELPSEKISQKENKGEYCLSVDNINIVCRTCLRQSECKDLFSNCLDNLNCAAILEMFTSIKLDPEDGLSMNICNDCVSELVHCYTFRQKCLKSQEILGEFKSELERVQQRNLSNKYSINVPLLDHDYEHTNNEDIINNILQFEKAHQTYFNNKNKATLNCDTEHNNDMSKTPKYVKRYFYVLKSNLNENKLPDIDKNIIEINEKKAQLLIQKSAESHQKIFLSKENELATKDDKIIPCASIIQSTNIQKDNIKKHAELAIQRNSLTARPRNKYNFNRNMKQARLLNKTFSDTIQKTIKLVLEGRVQQANRLAKNVPKLTLTGNRRRRKVKEKKSVRVKQVQKQIFPGNCRICNVPFLNKTDYSEHAKATKHYFIEFKCDICNKIYSTKHLLIKHKQSHTNEKRYMCDKCGLCFRESSTLSSHMKVHFKSVEQSFACKTCEEVFKYKRDLIKHRRVKHIEKKVCCEICGIFVVNKPCLMQHKKRMHLKLTKLEKCFICGKEFTKFIMQRHMRTHVTEKFKCKLCNCCFKYQVKHARHMKSRHPGADENTSLEDQIKMMNCLYCAEVCRNKQSRSIHMSEVHDHFVCKYCDTTFQTDTDLTTHYITHSNIKDCSCRYCGKLYESWPSLYIHLARHSLTRLIRNSLQTETKFYPCQYCNKTFLYKPSVQIHERTHTGERPYVCDICGKGNVCISSFKRHRSTHLLQNGQKIL